MNNRLLPKTREHLMLAALLPAMHHTQIIVIHTLVPHEVSSLRLATVIHSHPLLLRHGVHIVVLLLAYAVASRPVHLFHLFAVFTMFIRIRRRLLHRPTVSTLHLHPQHPQGYQSLLTLLSNFFLPHQMLLLDFPATSD
jgi:hypothetical protein